MSFSIVRFARHTYRSIRRRVAPPKSYLRLRDIPKADHELMERVAPYTMVSRERLYALIEAVRYVVRAQIPGAIVECGVWRGGASMSAILTLMGAGVTDREFYLYDTFEGMCRPTDRDLDHEGKPAIVDFNTKQTGDDASDWCRAELDQVRTAVLGTGYDSRLVHFVKGKVEDTIPGVVPQQIAILRLDTDFYESTRHELEHLYPRLSPGGVLLIDDYGYWEGCRRAVDEYFAAQETPVLLGRNDFSGRMTVKPSFGMGGAKTGAAA